MIEYHDLLHKGYSKQEAKRTLEIIEEGKRRKSVKVQFLDAVIYYILLLVAIVGNMVLSIILVPFLLAFRKIPLHFTIFILAAMFGFLFDQLIRDIEHLEKRHEIIAWMFIPSLAVINVYYMTSFTNHLTQTLNLPVALNSPLLVSINYVAAFIFPYIVGTAVESYK
jgi:hypothetical protein